MKTKIMFFFTVFALIGVGFAQFSQAVPMTDAAGTPDLSILNLLTASMSAKADNLMTFSLTTLASLIGLQFLLTNIGHLKSGSDIEAIFAKLIGSVLWFGFCIYVVNHGSQYMDSIGTEALNKWAPHMGHVGATIAATVAGFTLLLTAGIALGTTILGTGDPLIGQLLLGLAFSVLAVGLFMALKIFMLQIELGLVVLLAPLSFSLLGLNALKDQGIAPFKSLLSLIYRIVLVGIIYSAFSEVTTSLTKFEIFKSLDGLSTGSAILNAASNLGSAFSTIGTVLTTYVFLFYLLWKSDSIAASLAGGTTSMGTGDLAGAAAAGAAAGAAVAAAGSAVSGAVKPNPAIPKGLEVSNAGAGGGGRTPPPISAAPPKPATSLAEQGVHPGPNPDKADAASAGGGDSEGGMPAAADAGGSGAGAAIGGAGGDSGGGNEMNKQLAKLVEQLSKPTPKPTAAEKLKGAAKDFAHHAGGEKASVGVIISTHHSD